MQDIAIDDTTRYHASFKTASLITPITGRRTNKLPHVYGAIMYHTCHSTSSTKIGSFAYQMNFTYSRHYTTMPTCQDAYFIVTGRTIFLPQQNVSLSWGFRTRCTYEHDYIFLTNFIYDQQVKSITLSAYTKTSGITSVLMLQPVDLIADALTSLRPWWELTNSCHIFRRGPFPYNTRSTGSTTDTILIFPRFHRP
jgi:hypothetical protein